MFTTVNLSAYFSNWSNFYSCLIPLIGIHLLINLYNFMSISFTRKLLHILFEFDPFIRDLMRMNINVVYDSTKYALSRGESFHIFIRMKTKTINHQYESNLPWNLFWSHGLALSVKASTTNFATQTRFFNYWTGPDSNVLKYSNRSESYACRIPSQSASSSP